ncbi:MAG TPA: outer membrane lipoprotein carrier protein LolA [Terriglobia bacterium]|nr:outer membrane lipoprotein carrier protein LolA [Terriglobia bacterium]
MKIPTGPPAPHRRVNPRTLEPRGTWLLRAVAALVLAAGFPQAGRAQPAGSRAGSAAPSPSLDAYVKQFESSYHDVHTLRATFTQEYTAWNHTRVESGKMYLERGGKMRWEYQAPERKLFLSDGKDVLLYVPSEKQLTRTPVKSSDDVRVPLELLVSRLKVRRAFSKIEFASDVVPAEPNDRVLRAYPKKGFEQEYREVLVELTPTFDVRRLVVTYPDETVMKFTFDRIARNVPVAPALFEFAPPAGTEVIEQ